MLIGLLLSACAPAPATASPTAAPASPRPASTAPLLSTPTPLPPELADLLVQRDALAHEFFSTLDRAQAQNFSQEQINAIIRSYVPKIEAIEQQLADKGVTAPPLMLPPTPAVQAKKEVFDIGMVTEDGVHIQGTYYRPAAVNAPGVVLLHMLGRNRHDWDAFARDLQNAGYGVIAIDLRGHGDSGGKRQWANMTHDAAIAASFIRSRPEIDPGRIIMMGASIGANIAINAAAADVAILGVALLSPGLDYRGVKTEAAVRAYGARPLFIAASSEDSYAAQSARKLDGMAQGPHQLLILKNQGHGTQMLGKDNGLEAALFQWIADITKK